MNLTRDICIVGVPSAWVFRFYFPSFARGARRSAESWEESCSLLTRSSQSVSQSVAVTSARFHLFQIVKEADRTGSQLFLVSSVPLSTRRWWRHELLRARPSHSVLRVVYSLLSTRNRSSSSEKKDTHFSSQWRRLHSRRLGNTKCSAGPTPITVMTGRTRTNFRAIFLKSMFGNAVGRRTAIIYYDLFCKKFVSFLKEFSCRACFEF